VPEIGLDGASVVAVVGQLEPAGMPQHVGMNAKGEFRSYARPGHHALISGCGKRCASFRDEDVWGCWRFPQELAQCPTFPGRYRMHAGIPSLAGGESACAALMVFVNESELPWGFWSSQPMRPTATPGHSQEALHLITTVSHLSLKRRGWAGCCATSISEKSEPVPD